jgi:hypothetical protein
MRLDRERAFHVRRSFLVSARDSLVAIYAAHARQARQTLGILATVAALGACGGGGGGASPPSPPAPFSVKTLAPWPTLAAQCAAPRSGVDPYTGRAYPDRKGSTLDEQDWLASWTYDTYLWYSDVTYPDPAGYATAIAYFDILKSPLGTPSGKPKDQFHFTYPTSVWESLSLSGVQAGYGATWALLATVPPRQAVVAYTDPNSPATTLSPVLARGAQVLFVDGVDLVNDNTQAGINTLNAGLFPATVGESHTFVIQDTPNNPATRTITLVSANVVSAPVQNVGTLASSGGPVGYMLFNDHLATAEPALISAITQLQGQSITDLILDIRYNGGGYLDIASELAYMIAGPGPTSGKTFDDIRFNAKHPTIDPVLGTVITPTPFHSTSQGFTSAPPAGQALPYLGLGRVFVLTGSVTCSASEAVINGLRGVGIQVIQVGSTTCGKPYGFYPDDNCGTTYFSIQFQGVNQAGFGNYPDGFVPNNGATTGIDPGAVLPGCSVGDDFTHALGDPAEARVAAALAYRAAGSAAACPAPSGFGLGRQSLASADARVFKSAFLSNRIARPVIPTH